MQTARHTYVLVPFTAINHWLGSRGGSSDDGVHGRAPGLLPAGAEDLPYKVEVWSDDRAMVEQTVAMTANASIGYAAYYEATKEFPDHYVTLRHKSRVVARWNPQED